MKKLYFLFVFMLVLCGCGHEVLLETESFSQKGGWKVDQQFMDVMGSPYLIAHGAGVSVEDAVTEVKLPGAGLWHVYVRT